MHSLDLHGNICVNLDDFNQLSDSIRLRRKIDFFIEKLDCPKDISKFSVMFSFRDGGRYYLSNLYLWAIPYRTEGYHRGDVDHDPGVYADREYFIQREIGCDEMQRSIVHSMAERYKLHTTFAMVRSCSDCDLIIEAYNENSVYDPGSLYQKVNKDFEAFIADFLDAMHDDIVDSNPLLSIYQTVSDIAKTRLHHTLATLQMYELD